MPRSPAPPLVAIADDLTGAAELAAMGWRRGVRSVITTRGPQTGEDAGLVVYDTETRLLEAQEAAAKLRSLGAKLACSPHGPIYKKVDSVLRGPVVAEAQALAASLGFDRTVLVPANPSLGRTIDSGEYSIRGTPLHKTPFATDPHHPAESASVLKLLGSEGNLASARSTDASLPDHGIVVGDAVNGADLSRWARRIGPKDLPSGAAEFFQALLDTWQPEPQQSGAAARLLGPTLIVSGTTSPAGLALREKARGAEIPVVLLGEALLAEETAGRHLAETLALACEALRRCGCAVLAFQADRPVEPNGPEAIRRAFARLIPQVLASVRLGHVIVEGGATAAAIVEAFGWDRFVVDGEWAPGVVRLSPSQTAGLALTLKPGSYAWPNSLWQAVASATLPPGPQSDSLS